ncbi:small-conductance mechanosensitive channel [Chelatococcus caeni]|uniref:Small-conductance mechanosensitive channel n=1 Tax=Chelatococcus caeni TaxID=1348468 RepID=A0A840BY81_9HYPH|nr:mechanosensitive ion channel family protein [Chelatococcus caeni]MBB4018074.1 small-conductance mechanosensitive channel [Chelatococcus caeni]
MRAAAGLGSGLIAGNTADAHAGPLAGGGEGFIDALAMHIGQAGRALWDVLVATPQIPSAFADVWRAMAAGVPDAGTLLALAVLIGAAVLFVPTLVWRLAGGVEVHADDDGRARLKKAVRRLVVDAAGLVAMVAAAALLARLFLRGDTPVHALAVAIVGTAARWRLAMLLPLILLRPREPQLRLVAVGEERVRAVLVGAGATLAILLAFYTLMPVFVRAGMAPPPAQALGVLVGTLAAAAAGATLARFFAHAAEVPRPVVLGTDAIVVLVWVAWIYGIVALDFDLYHAAAFSALLALVVAALDRFLAYAIACCRPREAPQTAAAEEPSAELALVADAEAADAAEAEAAVPDPGSPHLMQILVTARRIVLAVTITVFATFFVRLWVVEILALVSQELWYAWREALLTAVGILVVGYILFELLRGWARLKFAPRTHGSADDHDAAGLPRPAGRLASVLPLLEGFVGALIVATAILVALSHLGVNIGPILAGAGIFGLAFSFGSQALVRDIVSGIFYLADDAFRVGEYIQAGSHKGMVERISVRSLRIRHQNGQFHTIPYGQLGAVTNFSRDWATVKFNLRLARDADVEQARKIAKKIGQDLLAHEEYGKDFIGPVKMQGVADVQENALVCRFKFTVKPGRQALIQREAVKRLFKGFTDAGIRFASNAVVVQGGDGRGDTSAAAAADLSRHLAEERAQAQG